MVKITGVLLIIVLALTSCGNPEMDSELVKQMSLNYESGVVAGVSIGDSWEDVKNEVHKEWEVDEENHSFSKTWDMFNNVLLSVDLDNDNKVSGLYYTINGKTGNHLLMAEIENALEKEFNVKYEISESEGWSFVASNGDKYILFINTNVQEDVGSNSLSIVATRF